MLTLKANECLGPTKNLHSKRTNTLQKQILGCKCLRTIFKGPKDPICSSFFIKHSRDFKSIPEIFITHSRGSQVLPGSFKWMSSDFQPFLFNVLIGFIQFETTMKNYSPGDSSRDLSMEVTDKKPLISGHVFTHSLTHSPSQRSLAELPGI